jgi:hypothetical protein
MTTESSITALYTAAKITDALVCVPPSPDDTAGWMDGWMDDFIYPDLSLLAIYRLQQL